jgi:hypothetical protein
MDPDSGRAGDSLARGSGSHDALDIPYSTDFAMAFVSDAVLYGRGKPLSVSKYCGTLNQKRFNTENTKRRAPRPRRRSSSEKNKREAGQVFPPPLVFPFPGKPASLTEGG